MVQRKLATLAGAFALVVAMGVAPPAAQAASGSFGGCSFYYSGSAAAVASYVTGITGCQGTAKVAARVYWYSSGTGTTEYQTVGLYKNLGNSTATHASGVYSRASYSGSYSA